MKDRVQLGYGEVAIADIVVSDDNKREDMGDLQELQDSIAKRGLLQPIGLHFDSDLRKYVLVWGHRRLAATKNLGCDHIKAIVLDPGEDANSLQALRLTENLFRKDLNPFEEAAQIGGLVDNGVPYTEIAKMIGLTPQAVGMRHLIKHLCSEAQAAWIDPQSTWKGAPLPKMAEIARLDAKTQADVIRNTWLANRPWKAFMLDLQKFRHAIKTATWDLEDRFEDNPDILGPCKGCPHRSNAGLLFEIDGDGKIDYCLSGSCWNAKAAIAFRRNLTEQKRKHDVSDMAIIRAQDATGQELNAIGMEPTLNEYNTKISKKKVEGAKPAMMLGGKSHGKTVWIVPTKAGASVSDSGREVRRPTDEQKRRAQVCDAWIEWLDRAKCADLHMTPLKWAALLACVGTSHSGEAWANAESWKKTFALCELKKPGEAAEPFFEQAWERASDNLKRRSKYPTIVDVDKHYADVVSQALLFGYAEPETVDAELAKLVKVPEKKERKTTRKKG